MCRGSCWIMARVAVFPERVIAFKLKHGGAVGVAGSFSRSGTLNPLELASPAGESPLALYRIERLAFERAGARVIHKDLVAVRHSGDVIADILGVGAVYVRHLRPEIVLGLHALHFDRLGPGTFHLGHHQDMTLVVADR